MSRRVRGSGGRSFDRFTLKTPSEMASRQRQGRRSPDEVNESIIDQALEEAGIMEPNMSANEKREVYNALMESNVNQVNKDTERLSLDSQYPPLEGRIKSDPNQSSLKQMTFSNQVDVPSSSSPLMPCNNSYLFEDAPESPTDLVHLDPREKPSIPTGIGNKDISPERKLPGCNPGVGRKPETTMGRGRAGSKKFTKYPPLQLSSPGHNQASTSSIFLQSHQESSDDNPQSPKEDLISPEHCISSPQSDPLAISSPSSSDLMRNDSPEELKDVYLSDRDIDDGNFAEDHDIVDIKPTSQDIQQEINTSGVNVNEPGSPLSVEEVEGVKEEIQTTKVGKSQALISPLEPLVKPMQGYSTPPWFEELKKYRGNKDEWMKRAGEIVEVHRQAHWDRIRAENASWGPPITAVGFNNKTLFKQTVPKYSSLFGSSTSKQGGATIPVRGERQSKIQAMSKMSADNQNEAEFHSLRRSRQKDARREDQVESKQESAWNTKKSEQIVEDEVQCLDDEEEDGSGSTKTWQSRRDQRRKPGDSDSDYTPDAASASGSHDVYEFDEWTPASSRNKKNNKRTNKSSQDDAEVEGKTQQRPRGIGGQQNQRGRSTKLRLQKGAISRPSEHVTSSNHNIRGRSGPTEQLEEETIERNNANSENRVWNQAESDNIHDIPPGNLNSRKVVQPRNKLKHEPTTRYLRENRTPNDFPAIPGSSGRPQEEAAVVETVQCPICGQDFPKNEIEVHADACINLIDSGNAVGEQSESGDVDSEGADTTVTEEIEKPATFGQIKHDQSSKHLIADEFSSRQEDCYKNIPSSSAGQKRGSSLESDDEPVKKTSRFME